MKIKHLLAIIIVVVAFNGCSTLMVRTAPESEDIIAKKFEPISEKAVIYVFRDESMMGGDYTSHFIINGKQVATGARNRYNVLVMDPGMHEVGVSSAFQAGQYISMNINLEPSQIYFLQVEWKFGLGFVLNAVSPESGKLLIRKGKLLSRIEL